MSDSRLEERSVGKWVEHLSLKTVRKLVVSVVGSTVVLIGVVFLFTPGQGLLTIYAGLAILATEFIWARVLLHKVRDRVQSAVKAVKARGASKAVPPNDPESDNLSASG